MGFTGGVVIGMFIGAAIGILAMCLFQVAGKSS
jgi:hypothetical protein